jgi:hypothetical protein
MVAACDQPGTTCTGTPACSSSAMRRRIRAALAAQHQQGFDVRAVEPGLGQRDRDLRGTAGKPARHEVQHATGRCVGSGGRGVHGAQSTGAGGHNPAHVAALPLSGVVITGTKPIASRVAWARWWACAVK